MGTNAEKNVVVVRVADSNVGVLDTNNLKVDTSGEEVEGDILIMLTNDEYLDDTIKIRFKIEAVIYENSLEIQDQSTYYLDSEGNENPLNYTNFLELFQMLDNSNQSSIR